MPDYLFSKHNDRNSKDNRYLRLYLKLWSAIHVRCYIATIFFGLIAAEHLLDEDHHSFLNAILSPSLG